jgi:hypothetical protein
MRQIARHWLACVGACRVALPEDESGVLAMKFDSDDLTKDDFSKIRGGGWHERLQQSVLKLLFHER